jgi:ribosomal protein L40E
MLLVALAVLWLAGGTFGEDETGVSGQSTQAAEACVYVGVKKCAFCHVRLDDSLRTWAITKHANALAVLSTPEARKHSKNPEQDPKCLKCHVTGMETDRMHGADIVEGEFVGVQCEMCHGPGQLYRAEMARALPKEHELDKQECTRRGLVIPNEQTCRKCHNEECPVFTGFDFEEAVKMIKHGEKQAKCEYIGQEKCTFCHVRVDESASTWVIMKHINAFSILKTKLAQKFSKDPVHDEKCLECHSTGLNVPGGYTMDDPAGKMLEGVQCEMCHGWGYSYVEVMAKAKVLGVYDVRDDCFRHGLVIPDEKVCLRCHNERCPVFTGFDFEASLKQLRHGQAFKKH